MILLIDGVAEPAASTGVDLGRGVPLTGGTADASAISAGSGRGTARPDRIAVASVVMMAPASSGRRFQLVGGIRIWVRGLTCGCSARHSIEPSAS